MPSLLSNSQELAIYRCTSFDYFSFFFLIIIKQFQSRQKFAINTFFFKCVSECDSNILRLYHFVGFMDAPKVYLNYLGGCRPFSRLSEFLVNRSKEKKLKKKMKFFVLQVMILSILGILNGNPIDISPEYGENYEGDILLTDEQKTELENPGRSGRTGTTNTNLRWPKVNGKVIVPYYIDNIYSKQFLGS